VSRLPAAARDHPRHLLAASLACGLALAQLDPLALLAFAALATILLTACGSPAHVAIAGCGLLLAGSGLGAARLAAIDADPFAAAGSGRIELRGELVQLPRAGEHGSSMRVRARAPNGDGQLIELRSFAPPPAGARIGAEVLASGLLQRVTPHGARTPEAASYARYLLRNGVRRRMQARSVALTGRARGGVPGVVDRIRVRSEDALAFGLGSEQAALLRGMILGGDAGIPESTANDFRVAGLSHILAVSGQNVLLIVILVQAMLMAAGAGRRWRITLPAIIIVIYVGLCGAQASVIRAGVMGLAGLAAIAASRASARVYTLLLAAIVVLAWNPRATADVGAQLSFAAVLGLMAFTRPLADRLTRFPGWVAEGLAATAGATIATAPLMAMHFGAVSIVSLAANVLGEPLIGPIVWLGSLTAAIGQVSAPLAALLNAPNAFLLGSLIELAHFAARVPGAQLATEGFGLAGLLIGFSAVVAIAAQLHGWIALRVPRAAMPAVACTCLLLAAIMIYRSGSAQIARPAIVMLDVGQGDATALLGAGGCTALIDGGPPGEELEQKLHEIGVRRLDAAVTTHPETDHFGGILELAQSGDIPIGALIDGGGNTTRPEYAELRARLAAHQARFEPAVSGMNWHCGDISIRVIGPQSQPPDAPPPANPNERAAVTVVDVGGLSMFASGDAESPQLLALSLAPADILKMPHHGSADPGLAAVLDRVRPSIAMIGVGASNRYGHPTPSAMQALTDARVATYRTDRNGEIIIRPAPGGQPRVSTMGPAR
jgi:competence protein ComEC